MPNHSKPLNIAIIFFASGAVWLSLFVTYGTRLASDLLPVLRWEISYIAPQYRLIDLRVARQRGEAIFKANVVTRRPLRISGRAVPAGIPMESSTLVGHLSQPLILLLSVVTTTCLVRHTKPLATLLLTFMAAGVIILIDVPFVLVGALEDMVLSVTSPSQGGYSVWVAWMNFLNGGGRLALAFAAALSVAAASEIGSRPSAVGGIRGGESVIEIPRSQRARLK